MNWLEGDVGRRLAVSFQIQNEKPKVFWIRYNFTEPSDDGTSVNKISNDENSDDLTSDDRNIQDDSPHNSLRRLLDLSTYSFLDDNDLFESLVQKGVFSVMKPEDSDRVQLVYSFFNLSDLDEMGQGKDRFYTTQLLFDSISLKYLDGCYLCLIIDQYSELSTIVNFCPEINLYRPILNPPLYLVAEAPSQTTRIYWTTFYVILSGSLLLLFVVFFIVFSRMETVRKTYLDRLRAMYTLLHESKTLKNSKNSFHMSTVRTLTEVILLVHLHMN
jgi:hypothetical protein